MSHGAMDSRFLREKPVENAGQSSAPKRQTDLHAGHCH